MIYNQDNYFFTLLGGSFEYSKKCVTSNGTQNPFLFAVPNSYRLASVTNGSLDRKLTIKRI